MRHLWDENWIYQGGYVSGRKIHRFLCIYCPYMDWEERKYPDIEKSAEREEQNSLKLKFQQREKNFKSEN